MIRIAAVGDPHITEGRRADEVSACLNFAVEDAIAQGAQMFLVAGDIAGHVVPHRATIWERNTFTQFVLRMAAHAPVVVITGNHDSPGDWSYLNHLDAPHRIYLREEADVIEIGGAAVFAFPFPHKRQWLDHLHDVPLDEQDRAIEGKLRTLFADWQQRAAGYRAAGVPTAMLAHVAVENALVAGGEIMPPGTEITMSLGDIDALGVDFFADGHIHQRQELRPNAWIIGTASRSAFNETDGKGYLLIDVASGGLPLVHPRQTPARQFVTIDVEWAERAGGTWGWSASEAPVVTDAEVRLRVTVPEAAMATADYAALEAETRRAGAHDVKIERRVRPKQELRCAAVVEAETLEAQLDAYWSSLPEAPTTDERRRLLARLATLQASPDLLRAAT